MTVIVNRESICCKHPNLKEVTELSMYMLSTDNLTKRKDNTHAMVYSILECMLNFGILSTLAKLCTFTGNDHSSDKIGFEFTTKAVNHHNMTVAIDMDTLTNFLDQMPDTPDPHALADILCTCAGSNLQLLVGDTFMAKLPLQWANCVRYVVNKFDISQIDPKLIIYLGCAEDADVVTREKMIAHASHVHIVCDQDMKQHIISAITSFACNLSNIRIKFVGELHLLPQQVQSLCHSIERVLCAKSGFNINIALAYDPIKDMRKRCDLNDMSDIDLVVRTGGEQRSSGFFPVSTLYSEWVYHPALFPDFSFQDLEDCIIEFRNRERRYGR